MKAMRSEHDVVLQLVPKARKEDPYILLARSQLQRAKSKAASRRASAAASAKARITLAVLTAASLANLVRVLVTL